MSLISRIPLIGFALNLFADIFCLHGTVAFVDLAAFDGTIYRICSIIARILVFGAIAALSWSRRESPVRPRSGAALAATQPAAGVINIYKTKIPTQQESTKTR